MGVGHDHSDVWARYESLRSSPQPSRVALLELSSELGRRLAGSQPARAAQVLHDAVEEVGAEAVDLSPAEVEATVHVLRQLAELLERLGRADDARDAAAMERRLLDRTVETLEQTVDLRTRQLEQALVDLRVLSDRSQLDPLTGLAGRRRLGEVMADLVDRRVGCAVLAIDLDRFGRLNETLGHQIGSDVFVVVMPGVGDLDAASRAADVVREALAAPFHSSSGESVVSTISVGVAVSPGELDDPEALLREADLALERAKALGKGRVEVFGSELEATARRRFDTEHLLRESLAERRFEMYFQPVHSNVPGYPISAEALIRLHHPDGTLLAPGAFLDVAEETGLARPIGDWVIDETCRIAAGWSRLGTPFRVAVNVSATQLDAEFPAVVAESLARHGLPPSSLVMELTEHTLLQADEEQVAALTSIRATGVHLALDDFGTAYSSLSHLRRFPVDVVKIDKSFVAGICRSDQDNAIVRAVVDLSQTFRFRVVAEGVETAEQLDQQRRLGCHGAQGYLIGRPKPARAFGELLGTLPLLEALGRS
jgi:EAL domain-containing protein (putative c-di-GMP-specific phosphodiesterase class I)/GGDEF domain-containing protein